METLPLFTKKNDLSEVSRMLDLLGHPEDGFRLIHVAGTNGKGSTCAFLEAIFRQAGFRTGLFTSPHLIRINERIRVQNREIPDDAFAEALAKVLQVQKVHMQTGGKRLTWFETLFVLSLCYFEKSGIDLLVCETGLGGRLDATNTIRKEDGVVITSVSLDHTQYLGDTVEKIAWEKAGIIRLGAPVIYCAKDPRSARVIAEAAHEKHAEPIGLTPDLYTVTERKHASLQVELTKKDGNRLSLQVPFAAEYQAENACLAALCALRLGAKEETIRSGIAHTEWPGRMQEIRPDVYVDGAHNPDAALRLNSEIRRIGRNGRVWLLTAIVSDKNHSEIVRSLCSGIDFAGVVVTSVGGDRQLGAQVLAEEFRAAGLKRIEIEPDVEKAYQLALREKKDNPLICTGSLYLAGEILAMEKRLRSGLPHLGSAG